MWMDVWRGWGKLQVSLGLLLAVVTSFMGATAFTIPANLTEYCESKSFTPQCQWPNEVVLMTAAYYGRMKLGICVESDLGFLGCQQNVLSIADRKCSGKKQCEIRIPDSDMDKTSTCYKELKVYLEASYQCVRVVGIDYSTCSQPIIAGHDIGHLLGNPLGPASKCLYWTLLAQPGQTISLSLVDFSWGNESVLDLATKECMTLGWVEDRAGFQNKTLCVGGPERVKPLMTTASNIVEIHLDRVHLQQNAHNFIITFKAVGCPDLRQPKDAWLERNHTDAAVGCIKTRQTWHLKCNGRTWIGVIGNCTQHLVSANKQAMVSGYDTIIPHGVAIVLIVGIAIIICVFIVFIGFICIRRYNQKLCAKRKDQIRYDNVRTDDDAYKLKHDDVTTISHTPRHLQQTPSTGGVTNTTAASAPERRNLSKKNEYSHIWEFPLPDPTKQERSTEGQYRGFRSNTDSAYGMSISTATTTATRPAGDRDENYHVSMASRATDDSRYFVLDRDPPCTPIPDDPDC